MTNDKNFNLLGDYTKSGLDRLLIFSSGFGVFTGMTLYFTKWVFEQDLVLLY
jgi:hypothetical protein